MGDTQQSLEIRVHLGHTVSAEPSKHLLTRYFLFQLHVNCLPLLQCPKPLPSTPAFVFG